MKLFKKKLTLDRPATYEIKIPGHLDEKWTVWDGRMTLSRSAEREGRAFLQRMVWYNVSADSLDWNWERLASSTRISSTVFEVGF